ncbi:hypothetical protein [Rhizobium deserti]|uniref:hypothetical protein n=1 Tax=Rhizobium deserti TaxID=2547961 RepID=UPI001FDF6C00|nr:hypothetical protein [Rhizobium deserti]
MMIENSLANTSDGNADALSVSHFLQPYRHFRTPADVVNSSLPTAEQRAVLASWASDLFAVESAPLLRHPPELPDAVRYSDVVAALKSLDELLRLSIWPAVQAGHHGDGKRRVEPAARRR